MSTPAIPVHLQQGTPPPPTTPPVEAGVTPGNPGEGGTPPGDDEEPPGDGEVPPVVADGEVPPVEPGAEGGDPPSEPESTPAELAEKAKADAAAARVAKGQAAKAQRDKIADLGSDPTVKAMMATAVETAVTAALAKVEASSKNKGLPEQERLAAELATMTAERDTLQTAVDTSTLEREYTTTMAGMGLNVQPSAEGFIRNQVAEYQAADPSLLVVDAINMVVANNAFVLVSNPVTPAVVPPVSTAPPVRRGNVAPPPAAKPIKSFYDMTDAEMKTARAALGIQN